MNEKSRNDPLSPSLQGETGPCLYFFEESYRRSGLQAQRRYPNEEFCRFMGRHFFSVPRSQREEIRILEVGCGSGANLWMVAWEGFDAYGVDLSPESLELAKALLTSHGASATLCVGDMASLPFEEAHFHCVFDVFSSYCLTLTSFETYLNDVSRVLRKGGRYFSYTPSKRSDAFINHSPAIMLDESTLDGIRRETSPYYGNFYPFRFIAAREYKEALFASGLEPTYCERVGRTYRNGEEYFEMLAVEATKSA